MPPHSYRLERVAVIPYGQSEFHLVALFIDSTGKSVPVRLKKTCTDRAGAFTFRHTIERAAADLRWTTVPQDITTFEEAAPIIAILKTSALKA